MPKISNVGTSENTPLKQEHFRYILGTHLRIVRNIYRGRVATYHYIDLNAGCGQLNGTSGSPGIFLGVAGQVGIGYRAVFVELNRRNYRSLAALYADRPAVTLAYGDNNEILGRLAHPDPAVSGVPRYAYGLVYADPNGVTSAGGLVTPGVLRAFAETHPRMDVLIHCGCTGFKRVLRVFPDRCCLSDYLNPAIKRYWAIRELYGPNQWTFLLGSNWDQLPERFRKLGFYPQADPAFAMILDRATRTRACRDSENQVEEVDS